MKEKIIELFKKAVAFAKDQKILVICSAAALAVIITGAVLIAASGEDNVNNDSENEWGIGITENIPEFEGECDGIMLEENFGTAYYSNVKSDEIEAYISKIETECGVEFEGDKYPRSAVYGDRIIAIHYNVTEMKFSVTVVTETANT